jgi:hypothetical protein
MCEKSGEEKLPQKDHNSQWEKKLAHLHFDEKKCGEGSEEVRKASLGGGSWGLGKGNYMVGQDKRCFGSGGG